MITGSEEESVKEKMEVKVKGAQSRRVAIRHRLCQFATASAAAPAVSHIHNKMDRDSLTEILNGYSRCSSYFLVLLVTYGGIEASVFVVSWTENVTVETHGIIRLINLYVHSKKIQSLGLAPIILRKKQDVLKRMGCSSKVRKLQCH